MSGLKNYIAGAIFGISASIAIGASYGPEIRDISYHELPNGPKIMYIDVATSRDKMLVQNPDGKYVALEVYLGGVDKEDRNVEKALIERMIEKERK
jgi:hypothetical protein